MFGGVCGGCLGVYWMYLGRVLGIEIKDNYTKHILDNPNCSMTLLHDTELRQSQLSAKPTTSTTLLHPTAPHCNLLQTSATHCTPALHCILLHLIAPPCPPLHPTATRCTLLHPTAPHSTPALHCTPLHPTATNCTPDCIAPKWP